MFIIVLFLAPLSLMQIFFNSKIHMRLETHSFIPLERDPAWFRAPAAQPVHRLVLQQRGVTQVLVDGVGGHFGDVLGRFGLDVEGDERVRHQVVDRLEPLLPDEVLPVVEQPVVEGLVTEPEEGRGHAKGQICCLHQHRVLSCALMVSAP